MNTVPKTKDEIMKEAEIEISYAFGDSLDKAVKERLVIKMTLFALKQLVDYIEVKENQLKEW